MQIGILKLRKEIFTFDATGPFRGVHGAVHVMIHGIGDAPAGMQAGIVGVLRASLLESCDEVLQLLLGTACGSRHGSADRPGMTLTACRSPVNVKSPAPSLASSAHNEPVVFSRANVDGSGLVATLIDCC